MHVDLPFSQVFMSMTIETVLRIVALDYWISSLVALL
jgi:hypothetical protein